MRSALAILTAVLDRAAATAGVTVRGTTVTAGDGALLLAGRPDSVGPVAAGPLSHGRGLVATTVSAVRPDGTIAAYHRPLGLTEAAVADLGLEVPPGADQPCGCGGHLLLGPDHLGHNLAGTARPTVVAVVDPGTTGLVRQSPASTLAQLLGQQLVTIEDRSADLVTLAHLVAGVACVRLGAADGAVARDWADQLLGTSAPEPAPVLAGEHAHHTEVLCGPEAVIVEHGTGAAHHLNPTATSVWVLHTDGLDPAATAAELGTTEHLVVAALDQLDAAGVLGLASA